MNLEPVLLNILITEKVIILLDRQARKPAQSQFMREPSLATMSMVHPASCEISMGNDMLLPPPIFRKNTG